MCVPIQRHSQTHTQTHKQNKTKQNKTKQNKTKQNITKQNKTKQNTKPNQSRASVATLRQTVEQLRRWREDKAADAAALFLDAGHEEEMALVAEEEGRMLRELEAARGAYQVGG